MEFVAYGDFNCPFSALASSRVDELERRGIASVEWRAVEHDTEIPSGGCVVEDDLEDMFTSELDQIRGLLRPDEVDRLSVPVRQVNTATATRRYAGTPTEARAQVRNEIFAAHWAKGDPIDDHDLLDSLGTGPADASRAEDWRAAWQAATDPIVPVLVLPDGSVSRGLGALSRLGAMLDETEADT